MKEEIFNLLYVVIGGFLSITGGIIAQKIQIKKEDKRWVIDKKLTFYVDLISILDSINMPIIAEANEDLSHFTAKVDTEFVKQKLEEFLKYIDDNRGMIFIFLSNKEYSSLVKLSSKIYSVISDEEKQEINSITDSEMMNVIEEAKSIANRLKKEIYKGR